MNLDFRSEMALPERAPSQRPSGRPTGAQSDSAQLVARRPADDTKATDIVATFVTEAMKELAAVSWKRASPNSGPLTTEEGPMVKPITPHLPGRSLAAAAASALLGG